MVEGMGFTAVRPILASGNVVFEAGDAAPEAIERDLHAALERATGLKSEVFVRNCADLETLVEANPFPRGEGAAQFSSSPSTARAADQGGDRPAARRAIDGPERMAVVGRELFTDFPEGQGRSTLVPAMQKARLAQGNTGRNWNTVLKLLAALRDQKSTAMPLRSQSP